MNPIDFVFISMPYSKFDSRWFANVPNINLGILDVFLAKKGKTTKTFHFHLAFQDFLRRFDKRVTQNLTALSQPMGIEFLGLDYVFASLLFEERYLASRERFEARLNALQLNLGVFEQLREMARSFVDAAFSQVHPILKQARLVGFSCSHYQLSGSLLLCAKIKEVSPNIRTVFGGKDCSGSFAGELLANMATVDFVGIGECEVTIESLLEHMEDNSKPPCNVVYRDGSGNPKDAPLRRNVPIKRLPFPGYDFRDVPVALSDIILPLEFGRGCPWGKCTFCPDKSYNVFCQSKTAAQVEKEIRYYQQASKELKQFIILDSDALKDPQLVVDLASFLDGKDFSFHFAEFRAEWMTRDVLRALSRFGSWVSPFQVGLETFSDSLLKLMNKGVSVLKNVEVLKGAVELEVPLQFNLFTCYPNMTKAHMEENLSVMDKITHLLVCKNIEAYPGEFYLPTDCPVFLNINEYGLERNDESIFADVFEEFPMPSYSNYPYPYEFDNHDEQVKMATMLREKVTEIKSKPADRNFMRYKQVPGGLRIILCREGKEKVYMLSGPRKELYMSAVEESKMVKDVACRIGMAISEAHAILSDFEKKGLVLFSDTKEAFLSLATREAD